MPLEGVSSSSSSSQGCTSGWKVVGVVTAVAVMALTGYLSYQMKPGSPGFIATTSLAGVATTAFIALCVSVVQTKPKSISESGFNPSTLPPPSSPPSQQKVVSVLDPLSVPATEELKPYPHILEVSAQNHVQAVLSHPGGFKDVTAAFMDYFNTSSEGRSGSDQLAVDFDRQAIFLDGIKVTSVEELKRALGDNQMLLKQLTQAASVDALFALCQIYLKSEITSVGDIGNLVGPDQSGGLKFEIYRRDGKLFIQLSKVFAIYSLYDVTLDDSQSPQIIALVKTRLYFDVEKQKAYISWSAPQKVDQDSAPSICEKMVNEDQGVYPFGFYNRSVHPRDFPPGESLFPSRSVKVLGWISQIQKWPEALKDFFSSLYQRNVTVSRAKNSEHLYYVTFDQGSSTYFVKVHRNSFHGGKLTPSEEKDMLHIHWSAPVLKAESKDPSTYTYEMPPHAAQ